MTCGAAIAGAIPVDRSAPDWWPRILTLLDRHAAKHRRFPSLWRSALRSDRPKQPGSNLTAPRESLYLSPSTGERLAHVRMTPGTACRTRTYDECLFGMQPHAMLRLRSCSSTGSLEAQFVLQAWQHVT